MRSKSNTTAFKNNIIVPLKSSKKGDFYYITAKNELLSKNINKSFLEFSFDDML